MPHVKHKNTSNGLKKTEAPNRKMIFIKSVHGYLSHSVFRLLRFGHFLASHRFFFSSFHCTIRCHRFNCATRSASSNLFSRLYFHSETSSKYFAVQVSMPLFLEFGCLRVVVYGSTLSTCVDL